MHESEVPSRVALVLQGRLAVIWNSPDGRRAFAGLIGPKELFGLTTFRGAPIPGDIEAVTEVTMLTWITNQFREIALPDPQLTIDLLDRSVYAIQSAIYMIKVRTFTTARSRLAGLLLKFEEYCFGEAPTVSRGQLGDVAGVSVRMVSSIIRQWESAGIVRRVGASGLELVDRKALEAVATPFNEFQPPDRSNRGAAHPIGARQTA